MKDMSLNDFTTPIPQALLDIEEKTRSNLFAWRGQFSPQLIEILLSAYCPPDSVVLDPFAGSGTVLFETPVSITSTHIDDVLIVKKAKRMSSSMRQEYR